MFSRSYLQSNSPSRGFQPPSIRTLGAGRALHRAALMALCVVASSALCAEAAALERFSATLRGGVRVTGNALGLSGGGGRNGPGTAGSLATFMADITKRDGDFPQGTTSDWAENASSALLQLPQGARVVYAELTWGASWAGGGASVADHLDADVTLSTSAGDVSVSPDPSASLTLDSRAPGGFLVRYYVRSADVTEAVQRAGAGAYTIRGVPGVQAANVEELNAGGWTLAVAYYDPLDAMRNVTIAALPTWIDESQTLDLGLSGFCAPSSGEVHGHLAIWAMEGDAHLTGDRVSIDAPAGAVPISSDANPSGNFFGAQLVARNGGRDLSGQHGERNHDAVRGENVTGGRQGWDIAQATLTSSAGHLRNGQRSARFLVETEEDSLLVVGAAFEIEMQAPRLALEVEWGERPSPLVVSLHVRNQGAASAQLIAIVVEGGEFASARVGGVAAETDDESGRAIIALGDLAPEEERVVELTFAAAPTDTSLHAIYEWTPCDGERYAGERSEDAVIGVPPATGDGDAGTSTGSDAGVDAGASDGQNPNTSDAGAEGSGADADHADAPEFSEVEADSDARDRLQADDAVLSFAEDDDAATPPERRRAPEADDSTGGCAAASGAGSSLPGMALLLAAASTRRRRKHRTND